MFFSAFAWQTICEAELISPGMMSLRKIASAFALYRRIFFPSAEIVSFDFSWPTMAAMVAESRSSPRPM